MTDDVPASATSDPIPTRHPAEGRTSPTEDAPHVSAPLSHFHKRSLIIFLAVVLVSASIGIWFGVIRTKPTDIVRGYLAALARGDSAAALAYGCNPETGPYLNDAVLARSQQLAPLTIASVSRSGAAGESFDGYKSTDVIASGAMGDNAYSMGFSVVAMPGRQCLTATSETVNVTPDLLFAKPGSIPLSSIASLLNGATIQGSQMQLFPGTYELTTPNTLVVLTNNTFTVSAVSSQTMQPTEVSFHAGLDLADGVPAKLATLAQADLDRCLAETTTRTTCGFGTKQQDDLTTFGTPDVDPSSLQWSLDIKPGSPPDLSQWMVALGPDFAYNAMCTSATGFFLRLDATTTDGRRVSQYFLVTPWADLSDPNNPRVEWTRA